MKNVIRHGHRKKETEIILSDRLLSQTVCRKNDVIVKEGADGWVCCYWPTRQAARKARGWPALEAMGGVC
jgi:hypothetical protein